MGSQLAVLECNARNWIAADVGKVVVVGMVITTFQ
jgi:hypothetical protein